MKKIITLLMMIIGCFETFSQMNYTNLEWVDRTPIVGNPINHTSSVILAGRLHLTGNTVNVNGDTDIMTIKYDTNGDTLWMRSFQGTGNGDDYGVEIKSHPSGAIFVVGAIDNIGTGYDYCVLKYSSTGTLVWSLIWNGVGNGIDVPSSINIEGVGGAVYVSGSSQASNGFSDYGIIKVSGTGSIDWETYYDFNDLHDGASSISYRPTGIVVTGGSASSIGDWDVATLKLNKTTGAIQQTTRTDITGASMVEIYGMTTDTSNNLYITGYAEVGGQKNIQTMKLDSNLALVWIANYAGSFDDVGRDIGVDASENIYVTGYTELPNGGFNFITIKYDDAGNQEWVRELGNAGAMETAKAEKLDVTGNGNIYLTGTIEKGGQKIISLVKYDKDGNINLFREFESDTVDFSAYDINVTGNDIYITGLGHSIFRKTLTILKFEINERTMVPVININNVPTHVDDEIIIYFHPDSIKQDIIDRKDVNFGPLGDFVEDGVIDIMLEKFPGVEWDKAIAYKIFEGMTTDDTTSITRTGFEIDVPPFWAMLLVKIPGQDEAIISDSLNSIVGDLFPHVQWAQLNEILELATDDEYYDDQNSLHANAYPNGDINIEVAWGIETGKSNIRVGVYDSGIMYTHNDLGGQVDEVDGKIRGGKDYYTGVPLSAIPNYGDPTEVDLTNGHGTKVAGIIGAFSNNETGIAGIGGGYWPYLPEEVQGDPNPAENKGLTLYGFRVVQGGILSIDATAEAFIEGSLNTTNGYGYALHVMNCSFNKYIDDTVLDTLQLMYDAQKTVFRNGTVLVAGKGNSGIESALTPAYSAKEFWVISVGGSDTLGNKHVGSNYGYGIDILAPYAEEMIYTTTNTGIADYDNFNGTSAATPHVTGVVGLMLSHINDQVETINNLWPDDVEFLIQRYAVDKYSIGYDDTSGWGLLDAGGIMTYINKDEYIIKHYYDERVFDTTTATCFTGNCTTPIVTFKGYFDEYHERGDYKGVVWGVAYVIPNNLNPGDSILDAWPLNSYTNLLFNINHFSPNYYPAYEFEMGVNNYNDAVTIVTGEILNILELPDGTPTNFWWPIAPGSIARTGYSLHLKSDYASTEENEANEFLFTCYPNPTNGNLTLSFLLITDSEVSVEIIDIQGRVVHSTVAQNYAIGQQLLNFDVNNLSKGMYVIRLRVNEDYYYEKFIKE